ncbi:MAG: hypothetical protein E6123_13880, partial [Clostridiales bacterium]|nr:hypothetical protein [Clostridiales bacterium]
MNISIGISTLNDGLYRVKDNIKSIPSEQIVIIVHQITNDLSYKDVDLNRENVILVTLYEKGLSKSRNTLLMKAFELGVDYLIISDDDVSYSLKGLIKL